MGKNDFNTHFIKAYYSHEVGFRKPYPDSFIQLLKEQHLLPEETVFIDDTLSNIEAAISVGLQTEHIVHPKTVLDLSEL